MDNPFVVAPRRRPLLRILRTLGWIVVALAALLVFQFGSQRWLLARLNSQFDAQPPREQVARLHQMAQLGPTAIASIVPILNADNPRVAEAAFELLQEQQRSWLQLEDAAADTRQQLLVRELARVVDQIEPRRRGWVANLANQCLVETVEHEGETARRAYEQATQLLARCTLSDNPLDPAQDAGEPRIAARDPLPLGSSAGDQVPANAPSELRLPSSPPPVTAPAAESSPNSELEPIAPGQPVPAANPENASQATPADPPSTAQMVHEQSTPVQSLVENAGGVSGTPFESYTTRSIISWLRSVRPELRDAANAELKRRGLNETQRALAARLSNPDIRTRIGLMNEITRRSDIDPRPWLFWLAEDAEPEVRRRAIAVLGTMDDANVRQQLRERLPLETDPAVADVLRRTLQR